MNQTGCEVCGSPAIIENFLVAFAVRVCDKCRKNMPQDYSLLTKTAAMHEFLLTSEELEDGNLLPHLSRPNPRNATWNNMQLFLRRHLVAFACQKYGSLDRLEEHRADWTVKKVKRKEKRFASKMADLRRKTRTDTWSDSSERNPLMRSSGALSGPRHRHSFVMEKDRKKCLECGYEVKFDHVL